MSEYKGLSPVEAAKKIRARQSKWGKIGASSQAVGVLEEIIIGLLNVVESYEGGLNKLESTKLKRQLAAANARSSLAAIRKPSPQDDDGDED